jgi:hypothetical protein
MTTSPAFRAAVAAGLVSWPAAIVAKARLQTERTAQVFNLILLTPVFPLLPFSG